MKIGIYGGTFNPPHIGHVTGAWRSSEMLGLDRLYVIPSGTPPHKKFPAGMPEGTHRFEMAKLAFANVPGAQVLDIEMRRRGVSYTADTVREIRAMHPDAKLYLITGTDMFLTLEQWYDAAWLLDNVAVAVTLRYTDAEEIIAETARRLGERGTDVVVVRNGAIVISSSDLRRALRRRKGAEYVDEQVYWYIIEHGLYDAKPELDRLRRKAYTMLDERRIRHVAGCEEEAVHLARRWGADLDEAREAAILHDITKRLGSGEQLELCATYGIEPDALERVNTALLHSKTAAAIAKSKFNVNKCVSDAILWHTTGRADMTTLEKVIYMADYIEPNRELDGIAELRRLAYEDIESALVLGMRLVLDDLEKKGKPPHPNTLDAIRFHSERAVR